MLTEKELKKMLKEKEKEQRRLELEKIETAIKLRLDYRLTIEIDLIKNILNGRYRRNDNWRSKKRIKRI